MAGATVSETVALESEHGISSDQTVTIGLGGENEVRFALDLSYEERSNWNGLEGVSREIERRASRFAEKSRNASLDPAESWLQTFAACWNRCQTYHDPVHRERRRYPLDLNTDT